MDTEELIQLRKEAPGAERPHDGRDRRAPRSGTVLSSISLLTRAPLFWQVSFVPIAIGLGVALFGLLR